MTSLDPDHRGSFTEGVVVARRFQLIERLGEGGAGRVFRAHDKVRALDLALKIHTPPERGRSAWSWRLKREFYLMTQLRHPRLVRVHDFGEAGEHLYYTMDLVDGCDAADLPRLAAADVLALMVAVASALGFLHSRGYVHQDVKPRNIRLPGWKRESSGRSGGDPEPPRLPSSVALGALLMDYGLLTPVGERPVGETPGFSAPETARGGPADARSDLYSLGVTAFVLLTGVKPPPGESLPAWAFDSSDAPPALVELIRELTAHDRLQRPADVAELLERLAPMTEATRSVELSAPAYLASPLLVGRDPELEGLRAIWKKVAAGHGGPAYLVADAGVGKSRLLSSFAVELRLDGATVLEAAGDRDLAQPFACLATLLRPLAHDPKLTEGLDAESAGVLLPLAAGHTGTGAAAASPDGPVRVDALAEQAARVRGALGRWLTLESVRRPLALVVDDLHRCDSASVEVLEHLGREVRQLPVLLLSAVRPRAGADGEQLIERLRRGALAVIVLSPFGPRRTERLVHALFGQVAVAAPFLDGLVEASGGNPYFVIELARGLVESGQATFEAGRWRLPRTLDRHLLPGTLDEALLSRVSRLGERARQLADALAVVAVEAPGPLLAATLDLEEEALFEGLEELATQRVARTLARGTSFVHPRVRELIYAALPEKARQALHARIARFLQARFAGGDLADDERDATIRQLGHHLARSGPDDQLQAVRWLRRAADRDLQAGHLVDALAPLSTAAEILERAGGPRGWPELVEVWEQLGLAAGVHDVERSLAVYLKLRDHLDRHQAWARLGRRAERWGSRVAVAVSLADSAVKQLAETVRQGAWAGRPSWHRAEDLWRDLWRNTTRYAVASGYLAIAQMVAGHLESSLATAAVLRPFGEAQGGAALAFAHLARAGSVFQQGRFQEVLEACAEVTRLLGAPAANDGSLSPEERARGLGTATILRLWVKALRGADDDGAELSAFAAEAGPRSDPVLQLQALVLPSMFHAHRGEISRLLAARAEFLDRCFKVRGSWQEAHLYPTTTPILAEAGLSARVRDDLRAYEAVAPPGPFREVWTSILAGALALSQGDHAAASRLCDQGSRLADRPEVRSNLWAILSLLRSADALVAAGQYHEAGARARDVLERARNPVMRFGWAETRALRHLAEAALGQRQTELAREQAGEMISLARRLANPGEQAHGWLLDARVALACGDPAHAEVAAEEAETRFARLGNALWTRRAAEVRAGASARKTDETTTAPGIVLPEFRTAGGPEEAAVANASSIRRASEAPTLPARARPRNLADQAGQPEAPPGVEGIDGQEPDGKGRS
jgi:hypothetical protein